MDELKCQLAQDCFSLGSSTKSLIDLVRADLGAPAGLDCRQLLKLSDFDNDTSQKDAKSQRIVCPREMQPCH